jgi:hypothetical protein
VKYIFAFICFFTPEIPLHNHTYSRRIGATSTFVARPDTAVYCYSGAILNAKREKERPHDTNHAAAETRGSDRNPHLEQRGSRALPIGSGPEGN